MKIQTSVIALLGLTLAACGGAEESASPEQAADDVAEASESDADAGEDTAQTVEQADYGDMSNWLCHPGREDDACAEDLSYTVVNADGTLEEMAFEPTRS